MGYILCTLLAAPPLAADRSVEQREGVDALRVRKAREAQNAAIIAADADLIASFWTEDVSIRRALGVMLNGREAYRRSFADDPKTVYLRHPTHVEISERWPLAFETGEWEGHESGPASPVVISGRYSAQWVKREGRWLIRAEVFVPLKCAGVGCDWKAVP